MDTRLSEQLSALLAEQPDVDAAWLVGSRARGQARSDSDVDVAVLLAPSPNGRDQGLEATLRCGRLADDLTRAVGVPVDVLNVESVAPVTFALIMRDARLLLERDRARRVDVMARQYALWHDMQPHYNLQREAVRDYFARRGT